MDGHAALLEGLRQGVDDILSRHPELLKDLGDIDPEAAFDLGRHAGTGALAPLIWSRSIGERWDVSRTTEFLRVSRQALYKRLKNGSLLGVRGRGTTWFPTWQFDPESHIVRPVVSSIVAEFRDAEPDLDPLVMASWATEANRLLDGQSPAKWITSGDGNDAAVVAAARRAVAGLRS